MSCCQRDDSNCCPLSVVMVEGTPNLEIYPLMKACATVSAVMPGISKASGESINTCTCQKVSEALLSRQGAHKISMHMYLVKPNIWCAKCCKWSGGVALNFGSLAFDAGASPIIHISIDTRPYKSCNHKALSSSYAWE